MQDGRSMGQVLHESARTAEAVGGAIWRSGEGAKALAGSVKLDMTIDSAGRPVWWAKACKLAC